MKKFIALLLAITLIASTSVTGTHAFRQEAALTSGATGADTVRIQQVWQEWNADRTALQAPSGKTEYMYPSVGEAEFTVGTLGKAYRWYTAENAADKYLAVKNTGIHDAYVRTFIALEMGSCTLAEFHGILEYSLNSTEGTYAQPGTWKWTEEFVAEIDGNNYLVLVGVHETAVKSGTQTIPSLLQICLDHDAGNDSLQKLDGNGNGQYDIRAYSEAVQSAGFENAVNAKSQTYCNAEEALNLTFGRTGTGTYHPWMPAARPVTVTTFNQLKSALESGRSVVMNADIELKETIRIPADHPVSIDGDNHKMLRAENFTGTMLETAENACLSVRYLTMDGAQKNGAKAVGNLIRGGVNSVLMLDTGTVLRNNQGASAVYFEITGSKATVIMNNAQILNNSANEGAALYGRAACTLSGDTRITGNVATTNGGAFRLGGGSSLTINGGVIEKSQAGVFGGAIYCYQSVITMNGGSISENHCNKGGAIYADTGTVITIECGSITGNTAVTGVAGIYVAQEAACTISSGATVTGNITTEKQEETNCVFASQ